MSDTWNLQTAWDEGYKVGKRDTTQRWERMREELTELHENNIDNPDVEGVTRFLLNWMKVVEKE